MTHKERLAELIKTHGYKTADGYSKGLACSILFQFDNGEKAELRGLEMSADEQTINVFFWGRKAENYDKMSADEQFMVLFCMK